MTCAVRGCTKAASGLKPFGLCLGHLNRFDTTGVIGSILTCTHLGCPADVVVSIRNPYLPKPHLACAEHEDGFIDTLSHCGVAPSSEAELVITRFEPMGATA